jgi:hypothetical protein
MIEINSGKAVELSPITALATAARRGEVISDPDDLSPLRTNPPWSEAIPTRTTGFHP